MSSSEEDTVEIFPPIREDDEVIAHAFDESELSIAAMTHRGKKRSTNEDQFAIVRRTRQGEVLASSLPDDHEFFGRRQAWLLAVADGLGGHVSGEVASAAALGMILKFANNLNTWVMRPTDGLRVDFKERAELYAQAIQQELQDRAKSNPQLAGMATTVTTAYVFGTSALIVNLGDSRSYVIRSGKIHQITRDHTLGLDLQRKGLTAEQARPYRNVLTRCFNTGGQKVDMDVFFLDLQSNDVILLCTDGLTDMVSDQTILQLIVTGDSTKIACERLVQMALDKGGRDNITVALSRVK